jgi:hypothetical protein
MRIQKVWKPQKQEPKTMQNCIQTESLYKGKDRAKLIQRDHGKFVYDVDHEGPETFQTGT